MSSDISAEFNISTEIPPGLVEFWNVNAVVETVVLIFGIYMILWKSSKHMVEYKWFLLNIALCIWSLDIAVGVFLRPISLFPLAGAMSVGLMAALTEDGQFPIYLVINLYILNNTTLALVNGFLYRCIALRPHLWLNQDKKNMYWFCALFQLVWALPESIILCFCVTPVPVMEAYIKKNYPHWFYITKVHSWAIWNPDMNPNCKWLLLSMAFFLALFVGFAALAIYGIFAALKENAESFSEQTIRLHRQLTMALMAQASIPFMMYIFPMGAALVMLFTGYSNAQAICTWLLILFCSHSNFNIILMLALTSCYRECIVDWVLIVAEKITGKELRTKSVQEISVQPSAISDF